MYKRIATGLVLLVASTTGAAEAPGTPGRDLAAVLARTCPAAYRRDYPIEVLNDLRTRYGLHSALPDFLEQAYPLSET